jgi:hypothetical protein
MSHLSRDAYKAKVRWFESAKGDRESLMTILRITELDELSLEVIKTSVLEVADILDLIKGKQNRYNEYYINIAQIPNFEKETISLLANILYKEKREMFNDYMKQTYDIDSRGYTVEMLNALLEIDT